MSVHFKQHTSLFDKSYSKEKVKSYKLYVEVSFFGIKHVVFDKEKKIFIGFEEYLFNDVFNDHGLSNALHEFLSTSEWYKREFETICISFVNNKATLIPRAAFQEDKLIDYHRFNFTEETDSFFFSDLLINADTYNVYSVPRNIIEQFDSIKNIAFRHFSSAIIESTIIKNNLDKAISSINVHVLQSSFQVTSIKNRKLELYNSFAYQSSEDFIYYLLFVLDQLNIHNEEAILTLTGVVERSSAIYSILDKYIQTLSFGSRTPNISFSPILDEIPDHFHYSLFNQFVCE